MLAEMKPTLAAIALLLVPSSLLARSEPVDVTGRFDVPDDLRVTLWAESPHLYNPTALDIDERGRIWVTEAVNYRKWNGRNPGRFHEAGDRVVILEDTDGDGACDSSKVFVQDEELVAPIGLAVIGDRVFVSCSPHLLVYRDTDGDDVADERQVFLTGFGGHDHDHGLHSVTAGPDGRLYFNVGNAGPHVVTDRSGFTLRSGSLYTGGGAKTAPNRPGLVSDDGRRWTGGLVLSVAADGTDLKVLAHNFRNPYEVSVDAHGDLWQSDNDDDGNGGCRTQWLLRYGNHGYFSRDGSRSWQVDRRPGQSKPVAHWHQDDPGVTPAGCINGNGGPTGVAVYEGGLLPDRFIGAVLNCDAGRSLVYAHHPTASGAGFGLERDVLIASRPGEDARLFRPSDVLIGSEGAIYVADWYDPGVGGHGAADREAYGRILRIAPADAPRRALRMEIGTAAQALAALSSPAVHIRERGRRWLIEHGDRVIARKLLLSTGPASLLRARAVWILAALGDDEALEKAARDANPRIRVTVLRARPEWAERFIEDPSPQVRRELALSIREMADEQRLSILTRLCARLDPNDRTLLEAIGLGAEGLEEELFLLLLEAEPADPRSWSESFAALAWRLHPPSCTPALMTRIMAAALPVEARRQALTALAFIPTRQAAEGMLAVAESGPKDLRNEAFWWLMHRDGNDWAGFGIAEQVGGDRAAARVLFESEVMREGQLQVDVDLAGSRELWLLAEDGGNGFGYDWADWIDPRLVGPAGELSLVQLGWIHATVGWGSVGKNRNAGGGPLAIDGTGFERGIGVHANSEILFRIPEGYDRLRAVVGPDDGGTTQQGSQTSVRFRILGSAADERRADPHLAALLARLDDRDASVEERRRATRELAADREGGALLIRHAAAGKLSEECRTWIAGSIFNNPDETVRTLASLHFERPGRSGAPLPPLPELVRMAGDPRRGQELFTSVRAGCLVCHPMRGRGGAIGPDLTAIHAKLDRAGLLDAILNPSAAIAFGYESWTFELKDGSVHYGSLLADGDRVVVKNLAGQRQAFDAEQIVRRSRQSASLMPTSIALGLEARELADLCAFLEEDPDGVPKSGEPVALFNGRDLTGWTEIECQGIWTAEDGVLSCPGRPIGYLRTVDDYTNFVLTLEWRTPPDSPPGNSGVLLRMTGEDRVWPDSIEAQLHSGNAGDIWNIGKFPMHVDAARTSGRRTVKLHPSNEAPLGEWNRYRITLNRGELRLEVNGLLQNRASWCEERKGKLCLQSEGAPIQFRNIELREIRDPTK